MANEGNDKYFFKEYNMRKTGIIILCILGYIELQLFVHSASACSVFSNNPNECSSDVVSK